MIFMKQTYKFALREGLTDKRFLPTRAEVKATGWDVRADLAKPLILDPFEHTMIPLGFRAFCPEGWWLELKPRSSTFAKKFLHSLYGTIDETYSGMMMFACQYIPSLKLTELKEDYLIRSYPILRINPGEPIGQLIPIERQEMEIIETSNEEYDLLCKKRNAQRREGGFGSTNGGK